MTDTVFPSKFAVLCTLLLSLTPGAPAEETLYNVAEAKLGATAKGTGANFNKDWLPQSSLGTGRRPGTIFDPFEGAVIDIRLVIPMDIEAVEIQGLDYRGTRLPSAADIYIDGEKVASAEFPDEPGKFTRVPARGFGQTLTIKVTGGHPNRQLSNGRTGPNWGGFGKIRVLSATDLEKEMAFPETYQVENLPDAIQSTMAPEGSVEVFVEVRQTEGHPNTFWDQKDIDHYKKLIETNEELREQVAGLKRAMDERMQQPLNVPQPRKNEDGEWVHLPQAERPQHNDLALDIANAATVYVLTDEPQYGEFAKQLLLAYAEAFPGYAPGNRPGFRHDAGRLFDQRLGDATWLIQAARGYDLIYNLPSITEDERSKIEDDLLGASARFIAANRHVLRSPTNWSAICTTAVLITGFAIDDQELVDLAMYGPGGSKENPTGGVMLHFSERSIGPDGLWSEGAMGYQGMAMQALVMNAEILRHHGMDMYSYRDAALKSLFDSPLRIAYPDLTAPGTNDSSRSSIIGRESYLWEYGYLRYRDPKYLVILNESGRRIDAQFQQFPVSRLYNFEEIQAEVEAEAIEWESMNFFDVGFGILRNTTQNGIVNLLLDYGPNRSHVHPDKMNIDLFVFGDQLIPDPGMVWYEQPLYRNWYSTTLAHNTLVVDELSQMRSDGNQLVFGFGDTVGIQRANASKAYAGVVLDRAVFLTPNYMADIFGGFARLPRTMDLAWHIRGDYDSQLETEPFAFRTPMEVGYSELADVRAAQTEEPYTMNFTVKSGERARFVAAGGTDTQVILGQGWLGLERPTTILQRRKTNEGLYGNLVEFDYDGNDYVKSLERKGSLEQGFAALVLHTVEGVDHAFASYRPGTHDSGALKTDALQAYVSYKSDKPVVAFLGGGQHLEAEGILLQRSEPGLAYFEQAETGGFVLGNPSPSPAIVRIEQEELADMSAYLIRSNGRRTGPAELTRDNGMLQIQLPANGRVEFAREGGVALYEYRQNMLRQARIEQEAAQRQALNEALERHAVRAAEAAENPVPDNTQLIIQADAFTAQGGGSVSITPNKVATIGNSFARWDGTGHWLEYTAEVPEAGYYHLTLLYCSQLNNAERIIEVNGENQEPFAVQVFPATGGWANGSDDWRLFTCTNPATEKPLLIKMEKGENIIRLTNANGRGVNLDYLMVTSPDVPPQRLQP